jgi:oligopeptide/dipeptide ABC transporter ATP-binding protein
VELAEVDRVLRSPQHPYTAALLNSLPGAVPREQPLTTIPGTPPQLIDLGTGCRFADRCAFAEDKCVEWRSSLLAVGAPDHGARCIRHDEIDLSGAALTGDTAQPPNQQDTTEERS